VTIDCAQITEQQLVFEHPMNESMRVFLRIESLLHEFYQQLKNKSAINALTSLLKTINVLDRPDLKTKVNQRFNQHASSLSQLKPFDQVDPVKLTQILNNIDALKNTFNTENHFSISQLKRVEFLNHLRLQLSYPGGIAINASYSLQVWLHQPIEKQFSDLNQWASNLTPIRDCIHFILRLTRASTQKQQCLAHQGSFLKNLNPNLPLGLIQVIIDNQYQSYPKFVADKHRLHIHFIKACFNQKEHKKTNTNDIHFHLHCCQL
jgi:cell division protein ZapD